MANNASVQSVTHRRILTVAFPIVLSNATIPLLGVVDTFAIGQLGAAAPIGAVAVGAVILSAIYWIFGFLRMGTTGLVAQAVGANAEDEVAALLSRALLIALAAGAIFILFQHPISEIALRIFPASDAVEELTRGYILTRIWGAPAAIAVYALTGWLIAQERTSAVLSVQMVMNGGNILLSLWFVLGLGWSVEGVALATVISEWTGAILGLWLCRAAFSRPAWRAPQQVFDRRQLSTMMSVNSDIMIRSVLLQICFLSVVFQGAKLGDVDLAANQILLQLFYVSSYALDGFAFASEAMVGSALGARHRDALRRAAVLCSAWGIGLAALIGLSYLLIGPWLITEMTTATEVVDSARHYLFWAIAAAVLGAPAFMLDGIFIGATRTRDMRNMMLVSATVYFAALFPMVSLFGNHGLWAALLLFFILRAVTLGACYPALERSADR